MRKEFRDLVICNNCQWAASLLMDSHTFVKCPNCITDNIEIVPVQDYEKYSISINKIGGVGVEFSDDSAESG